MKRLAVLACLLLAVLLLAFGARSLAAAERIFAILVDLAFEGEMPPSGPDTFAVFEQEKGQVRRSYYYRTSGELSLEITDHAGNGDFPELQGYFDKVEKGGLFCHFAFLVTTPEEDFNIALAGPDYFTSRKDGIAFWLENQGGRLVHYSNQIPSKLFDLQGFTWYFVALQYHVGAGTYDLTIRQEGTTWPLVALRNQINVSGSPGSVIDKYSFIGDRGSDQSNVVYYVDDLRIAAGEGVPDTFFAAPGRRRLFIDMPQYAESEHQVAGEDEIAADRLLREGNALAARDLYLFLVERTPSEAQRHLWLKLADAYWLLGDVENERKIRETFFGSLN
jgi:hypothetical protein